MGSVLCAAVVKEFPLLMWMCPCVVRVGPVLFVWRRLCLVVAATLT